MKSIQFSHNLEKAKRQAAAERNICSYCGNINEKDNFLCSHCGFYLDMEIVFNDDSLLEIKEKK